MGDVRRAEGASVFPADGADELRTGPGVGEVAPDFALPDQHGRAVTLSGVLRESRALLVFHRSARW